MTPSELTAATGAKQAGKVVRRIKLMFGEPSESMAESVARQVRPHFAAMASLPGLSSAAARHLDAVLAHIDTFIDQGQPAQAEVVPQSPPAVSPPSSSVFGELPGYPVGSTFSTRDELRRSGLHRHLQAGISGAVEDGADAIVVSGGYPDDEDEGERLIYTGQGGQGGTGRQVQDQELIRGNLALVRSEERGLPVRVIRGARVGSQYAPATGYRYDGLYTVSRHWSEPSTDGPLIWRFVLEKADGGVSWQSEASTELPPPPGETAPSRATSVTQRLVRNSAITQWVKKLYDDTCQMCGVRLEVDGGAYSEGAHIRALGRPHNGADVAENVLCLCPNDHVLFDKGALFVAADRSIYRTADRSIIRRLTVRSPHEPGESAFEYHRQRFAGIQ